MSSNASLWANVQRTSVVLGLLMLAGGLMANTLVSSPTVNIDPQAEYSPADEQGRFTYLIDFVEPSVIDQHRSRSTGQFERSAPANMAWRSQLQSLQAQRIDQMSQSLGRSVSPSHHYLDLRNGIALNLTRSEADRIASLDGVQSVERERVYSIDTFRGPDFIGAPAIWDGSATPDGSQLRGELMVAAILDSGIGDPSIHPSFDNDPDCGHGIGGVPDKVISNLDCSSSDVDGLCNGTVNPFDENGHGSHTASTTAGNRVTNADTPSPELPPEFDSISGVAYCAHIRSYDVCSANGGSSCGGADLEAGLASVLIHTDPAVIGAIPPVSVMNYSISGGRSPWADFDRDKLDLVDAGVFVAASAGNTSTGEPDPVGLVSHRGPWVMSVAASTHDGAIFDGNVSLAGGPQDVAALEGSGPTLGSTYTGELRWAGDVDAANNLGCDPFPVDAFDGEAALIERGACTFVTKVDNAVNAGADFVIVFTDDRTPVNMAGLEATAVSAFMINRQPGLDMVTALAGGTAEVTVVPETVGVIDPATGDILAGFSLRGPTPSPLQDLQKPNITAPGVNIFAADVVAGGAFGFGFKSGTSMSSPHVAGSAILVRQANPDWTVSETKSAMQLTAFRGGFKEDGTTPWDWDDVGHGRVDLNVAALAGFVLDESIANYLAANPADGGDVKTLNTPDVRNVDCSPSCSFTRTIRNTYDVATDWTVTIENFGSNVDVQVSPATFSFTGDVSETQEITIDVEPIANMNGEIEFGIIRFDEDSSQAPQAHFTTAISGNLESPPEAEVDQTEFTLLVEEGAVTSATFNISNVGEGPTVADLNYNIDEAAPASVVLSASREADPPQAIEILADNFAGSFGSIGAADQSILWFNQLTPGPTDIPFDLEGVALIDGPSATALIQEGDVYDIYVWSDPDRTPGNGDEVLLSQVNGVTHGAGLSFRGISLPAPVPITDATGDVLIGAVNRTRRAGSFPARGETSGMYLDRAFIALNFPGGEPADPPVIANASTFGTIASLNPALARNWVIRGFGTGGSACLTPSDVPWLTVTPSSGSIAQGQSEEIVIDVDTAGLAQGSYEARVCVNTDDVNNPVFVIPVSVEVTEVGGLPTVELSESSLTIPVDVLATSGSSTFDITNLGTALDLEWSIDEVEEAGAAAVASPLLQTSKGESRSVVGSLDGRVALSASEFASVPRSTRGGPGTLISVDGRTTSAGYDSGDPDNSTQTFNIGVGNQVVGFGYEVNIATVGPSWLSESSLAIVTSQGDEEGLFVTPSDIEAPGDQDFSSDGLVVLADVEIGPIVADDDGNIFLEWFDTFDDDLGVDSNWSDSGSPVALPAGLTLLVEPVPSLCLTPSDVSWLTVSPASGTTAAGTSDTVTVDVDATGFEPGIYEALVCVNSNDPATPLVELPVTMEVTVPAAAAILEGTVESLGRCEANPFAAAGASIEIVGSIDTINAVADANGFYSVFIDEANGPVDVTASAPAHVAETQAAVSIAGETTTTVDFGLVQLVACAEIDNQPITTSLESGDTGIVDLTIDNSSGAVSFDWDVDTEAVVNSDPRGHFPAEPWQGPVSTSDFSTSSDPYRADFDVDRLAVAGDGPFGAGGGPTAYTTTSFTAEGYVSLDVTDAGNLTIINATQPLDAWAATFIGDDFSQQYALGSTATGDIPLNTFGTIDVATGVFTAEGLVTGTPDGVWLSMKWDGTTQTLYAIKEVGTGPFVTELYTINTDTLEATLVGDLDGSSGHIAIAINNAGQMFGLDIASDILTAIDKTDGTAVPIGPLGFDANFVQDMDFDRITDTLYWSAYLGGGDSRMTTVDVTTGSATEVGTIGGGNEFLSMSIATPFPPQACSDPSIVPWVLVVPASGSVDAGDSEEVSVIFDSRGLESGLYQANLCFGTTDLGNPLIAVPVNMIVNDGLFSDRFEQ